MTLSSFHRNGSKSMLRPFIFFSCFLGFFFFSPCMRMPYSLSFYNFLLLLVMLLLVYIDFFFSTGY